MPNPVSLANQPVVLQGVTGSGYDAVWLRRMVSLDALQEGVFGSGDFKVTTGGGMTINVAAGQACVQGDAITDQGLYYCRLASTQAVDIPAADPTNPRIDYVVLEIKDTAHDGSGSSLAQLRVVAGNATNGATLDNPLGQPTLPASARLLAMLRVPAGAGTLSSGDIRDRRSWARGAYKRTMKTDGDVVSAATSLTAIPGVSIRMECTGVPLALSIRARIQNDNGVGYTVLSWFDNGAPIGDPGPSGNVMLAQNQGVGADRTWDILPAAGTHLFVPAMRVIAGTGTLSAGNDAAQFIVEEKVRQNASND